MAILPLLLMVLAALVLIGVVRLRLKAGWLIVALRAAWLALGLVSVVVVVVCVAAVTGDGRVGSDSVSVGFGEEALVVQMHVDQGREVFGDDAIDGTGGGSTSQGPSGIPAERPARVGPALRTLAGLAGPSTGGDVQTPARVTDAVVAAPIPDPTWRQTLLVIIATVISLIPLLGGLIVVERLLRRAAAGNTFCAVDVRDLRLLAVVIGVGSYIASLTDFGAAEAVAGGRFDGLEPRLELGLGPLAISLMILALAEVWRHGLALREEVELTV
jgi:hypothetical protein